MINQNLIVDYLSKSVRQTNGFNKNSNSNIGLNSNFNDTLNSTMGKTLNRESRRSIYGENRLSEQTKRQIQRDSQRKELNSSGLVRKENSNINKSDRFEGRSTKTETDTRERTENVDVKKDLKEQVKKEVKKQVKEEAKEEAVDNLVLDSVAGVLGISKDELKSILAALNVDSAGQGIGLTDEEASARISGFLGLSSEEEKALADILVLVKNEVESTLENMDVTFRKSSDVEDADETLTKLEGIHIEMTGKDKERGPQELSLRIKSGLLELKDKLTNEPDALKDLIAQKVDKAVDSVDLTSQSISNKDSQLELKDSTLSNESQDAKDNSQKVNLSDELADKGNSEGSDQQTKKDIVSAINKTQSQDIPTQENDSQFGSIVSSIKDKTDKTDGIAIVKDQLPITKKEIVSQVVEKAKVILDEGKSEMVLDLKPEHLGKLSLKIITERGIVMAKFVAESEQVKAALETNMDTLKESLEKQGFSVQGFSVSVGQDSRRSFNNNDRFPSTSGQKGEGKSILQNTVTASGVLENQKSTNPYEVREGSIDLTA